MLIPAYKDMDPYDLPEEFSHLQAQDMTRLGFMQDLIRGIKKIIGADQPQAIVNETVVVQQAAPTNANVQALLDRGNMALEDGEWGRADGFFEDALNQDAKLADAYIGKFMAKCKCSNIASLTHYYISKYEDSETEVLEACPEDTSHIEAAISKYSILDYLSDSEIREQYEFDRSYVSELSFRKQQKSQEMSELAGEKLLARAQQYASVETKKLIDKMMADITVELDGRIAEAEKNDNEQIESIKNSYEGHLTDADAKVKELYDNASESQESDYASKVVQMNAAKTLSDYENVRDLFKEMHGYKDTDALVDKCQAEIDRMKEEWRLEAEKKAEDRRKEAERLAKKERAITAIAVVVIVVGIVISVVVTKVIIPNSKYNDAVALMNSGKYEEAIDEFETLGGYKDSNTQIMECNYKNAAALLERGNVIEAYELFTSLNGYNDSEEIKKSIYDDYKLEKIKISDVGDTVRFGDYNGNTEWIVLAKEDGNILVISKYAIEERPYNLEYTSITWENCTLRSWLNSTYLTSTFSSKEQSRIVETSIANDDKASGTDGENDTTDKVFLLSIEEAEQYFTSDSDRQATLADGTSVWWWLRSPGYRGDNAANVSSGGSVLGYGSHVDFVTEEGGAVRPALWINTAKL